MLLPNRKQMELRASDLESLLAEGHRARLVWAYVERQDLRGFYEGIRAVDGGVGRSAISSGWRWPPSAAIKRKWRRCSSR